MSKNKETVPSGSPAEEQAQTQAPAKGGDVITLTADTREQLQEDSLKYLAENPGSYALGAAGYCAEIGQYTLKIKTKEE